MEPTERSYYEIRENWEQLTLTPVMRARLDLLRALVPTGVRRILDLGCGNGVLTNELARDYSIVALDWSRAALGFARTPRLCASSAAVPLRAGAFDLILCSELLEHLIEPDFHATTREILRLGPRYLLLSVPNRENLHINEVRCPECRLTFNASHHQRSFSPESLAGCFPGYHVREVRVGGMPVRDYPAELLRLRQRIGGRWFQVPDSRVLLCPACGNKRFPRVPYNPISFYFDLLNRFISRRRPYWLFLLLERQ
jgi:SAM-dependent methyltransferase